MKNTNRRLAELCEDENDRLRRLAEDILESVEAIHTVTKQAKQGAEAFLKQHKQGTIGFAATMNIPDYVGGTTEKLREKIAIFNTALQWRRAVVERNTE